MIPDKRYCCSCHAIVAKTDITYIDAKQNHYCRACELEMRTKELQTLVERIDFLKNLI